MLLPSRSVGNIHINTNNNKLTGKFGTWGVTLSVSMFRECSADAFLFFIALVIRLSTWINWATSKTGQSTCLLFYLWSCVIIPCGFSHDLRQPIGISTSVFNSTKAASVTALLADRFAIHQPALPAPLRAAWQRRGDGGRRCGEGVTV